MSIELEKLESENPRMFAGKWKEIGYGEGGSRVFCGYEYKNPSMSDIAALRLIIYDLHKRVGELEALVGKTAE